MGFIFSMADPNLSTYDEDDLKAAIKDSRGVGNFRSLLINNRSGKADAEKEINEYLPEALHIEFAVPEYSDLTTRSGD